MTIDGELVALSVRLGTSLGEATRIPWGDANATWRLRLGDGRDVIGRRFAQGEADHAGSVAAIMTLAVAAGIPVPDVRLVEIDGVPWLITDHVRGSVGAAWLDTPARARSLAAAMGSLRQRLFEIDPSAVAGVMRTNDIDRSVLDAAAGQALEAAESTLSERRARRVFVHGDFAPINVILDGDGDVHALLDFEHARLGDPLEDAAWWCWVVRHHHPDAWRAAWPTFCTAAGVDQVEDGPTMHALMLRELGRRAAAATGVQVRDRWLAHLDEAAAWRH
jgi:aminoglycoside phosphotransferase (APT) family kinase protein